MSEVNALKTLRETTLAHLAQSDYEKILKAVEVGGIESLTGTALMIVKSAVLKHGAHDQSSHNPKKGGGGGGAGSGGSSGTSSAAADAKAYSEKTDKLRNRLYSAEQQLEGAKRAAGQKNAPAYQRELDRKVLDAERVLSQARMGLHNHQKTKPRVADIKSPAFPMGTYGESFGD